MDVVLALASFIIGMLTLLAIEIARNQISSARFSAHRRAEGQEAVLKDLQEVVIALRDHANDVVKTRERSKGGNAFSVRPPADVDFMVSRSEILRERVYDDELRGLIEEFITAHDNACTEESLTEAGAWLSRTYQLASDINQRIGLHLRDLYRS